MNVKNVKDILEYPEDIWQAIFNKQLEIAKKYAKIERMGNLLDVTHVNTNTANGQKWIKDFAWRVTEELAEAQEAKENWKNAKNVQSHADYIKDFEIHYWEEIIDALHFLTELTIIAGYNENIVYKATSHCKGSRYEWHDVVYSLGLMCNTLKNKPWKQTQMLTDSKAFENYLIRTWECFLRIFEQENIVYKDIYNLYFKKNEVNHFRIRSKY